MHRQSPTTAFLLSSYGTVKSLNTYILEILDETHSSSSTHSPAFSPTDTDTPAYHHLLHDTYVATNQKFDSKIKYEESHVGMDEVGDNLCKLPFQIELSLH
jgi:hypothetical protein